MKPTRSYQVNSPTTGIIPKNQNKDDYNTHKSPESLHARPPPATNSNHQPPTTSQVYAPLYLRHSQFNQAVALINQLLQRGRGGALAIRQASEGIGRGILSMAH
jgi:hypothetical protein